MLTVGGQADMVVPHQPSAQELARHILHQQQRPDHLEKAKLCGHHWLSKILRPKVSLVPAKPSRDGPQNTRRH